MVGLGSRGSENWGARDRMEERSTGRDRRGNEGKAQRVRGEGGLKADQPAWSGGPELEEEEKEKSGH